MTGASGTRRGTPVPSTHIRICDFTGQLAGAGDRVLAAFGAQVIRVEDPVRPGPLGHLAGIGALRRRAPRASTSAAGSTTTTSRSSASRSTCAPSAGELLAELVGVSDVVTENFAAGVMERLGFGYERLRELRPDIVYVSNCGFGHDRPVPRVQDVGADRAGVSRADLHVGPARPAARRLGLLVHGPHRRLLHGHRDPAGRSPPRRTGEGQWVDMACTEAGVTLNGPAVLDCDRQRPAACARDGVADTATAANRRAMAPHGIYPCRGDDAGSRSPAATTPTGRALVDAVGRAVGARRALRDAGGPPRRRRTRSTAQWRRGRASRRVRRRRARCARPACRRAGAAARGAHATRDPEHRGVGAVARGRPRQMGRVRVDGLPGPPLGAPTGRSSAAPLPRRAQRVGLRRAARALRRRDRGAAREGVI